MDHLEDLDNYANILHPGTQFILRDPQWNGPRSGSTVVEILRVGLGYDEYIVSYRYLNGNLYMQDCSRDLNTFMDIFRIRGDGDYE